MGDPFDRPHIRALPKLPPFSILRLLLRGGEVEAIGVKRGVGVEKLHQAVAVGVGGAEVLPVQEIGAGLEIEILAGSAYGLQQEAPVSLLLQKRPRRVFDNDK